jgi:hypothetical protein
LGVRQISAFSLLLTIIEIQTLVQRSANSSYVQQIPHATKLDQVRIAHGVMVFARLGPDPLAVAE